MVILKVDDSCYIWFFLGRHPYVIAWEGNIPVATRETSIKESPEEILKFGDAELVKWEEVPELVKNCIVSTQEVIVENASKYNEKNKK